MDTIAPGDDRICIRGLEADCIIGIMPVERVERQRVRLDLDLSCDLSRAAETDDLADTLDYKALRDRLFACIEGSRDKLLERLALRIVSVCLAFEAVRAVTVRLAKPGALTGARDVAVVLTRSRDTHSQAARERGRRKAADHAGLI